MTQSSQTRPAPKPGSWINRTQKTAPANRHLKGAPASQGGRFRGTKRIDGAPLTVVAPPITYRSQPNLGHGRDLDLFAEQFPDLEVFTFDDDDDVAEVNPSALDSRRLGEYVGILSSGY